MPIANTDVLPNEFLDNLGTDWIGVNNLGQIIARAGDADTVKRAAPDEVVAVFNAANLAHLLPPADVPPSGTADELPTPDTRPEDSAPVVDDSLPSDVEPPKAKRTKKA